MATAIAVDPGSYAIAVLVAMSGAAPKGSRFYPHDQNWGVPPIIWGALVGDPRSCKTATLSAFAALLALNSGIGSRYAQAKAGWEARSRCGPAA
jgi:hypothetical protein